MRRLAILVALAACSDRDTVNVEEISAKVCACKTSKCATAALDELPKVPPNGSHRIQTAAEDARNCLAKLIDAEKTPPLDEEGSGATSP